jgi:phasin family protein
MASILVNDATALRATTMERILERRQLMVDQAGDYTLFEAFREIVAIHLRNMEALAKAQQSLIEGNKLVLGQQLECFQTAMDRISKTAKDILSDRDPRSNVCRRFDLIKDGMKQNTCDTSMLAELGSKFSGEASSIIQERVYQSLDEAKAVVAKLLDGGDGAVIRVEAA